MKIIFLDICHKFSSQNIFYYSDMITVLNSSFANEIYKMKFHRKIFFIKKICTKNLDRILKKIYRKMKLGLGLGLGFEAKSLCVSTKQYFAMKFYLINLNLLSKIQVNNYSMQNMRRNKK